MTENQTPDAFEAALAANADELTAGVAAPVEEIVEEVISIDAPLMILRSLAMKMAILNQMRTIQMQNSVAPFAQRSAIGM
jgi:hypothetical protein